MITWKDIIDLFAAVGEWVGEHVFELILLVFLALVVLIPIWITRTATDATAQQIDLCMRAFNYTHDQCEFIVRNHIMVSK